MLWHGAHHDDVGSILSSGLRGAPGQPTVTDSREGAELHAQKRDWTAPKVLEIHVPLGQADRYLDEPEQGTPIEGNIRSLRATLPPEFIRAVHDAGNGRTAAAWSPSSGIFAPTTGLDQRLFEGGSLRPAVRGAVMERLDRCLRVDSGLAGSDWQQWLHVWIAGGSASEWAGSRPNDEAQDLDVIVGLDLREAQGNSSFEGMDQAQAATALNAAFRHCFNETGWRPEFGGTWDLTAYCNPHVGSDITVIRPYAAWDLSDWDHPGGSWSVRPPHLPGHTLKDFDPAVIAHGRAVLAEARAILRMPEPLRTREARSLWEHVHEHRCQAFSAEGTGWDDPGNVDEKMLAYAPRGVLEKIRELANNTAFIDKVSSMLDGEDYDLDLYHHTDPEAARDIARSGVFRSEVPEEDERNGEPHAYFSSREEGSAAEDYGAGAYVHVRVPSSIAKADDYTPHGEIFYRIPTRLLRREHIIGAHPIRREAKRTIDLYHRTDPEHAEAIMRDRKFIPAEDEDDDQPYVYFSDRGRDAGPNTTLYGPSIVHVRIPGVRAEHWDEMEDGENHYRVPEDKILPEHVIGVDHTRPLVTERAHDHPDMAAHLINDHGVRQPEKFMRSVGERGLRDWHGGFGPHSHDGSGTQAKTAAREEAAPEEQDYWTSHRAPGPGHTGQDDRPRASVPYHETAGRDPDDLVDVYRAAPEEADTINRGDWVTLHGDWARERAENSFEHHVLHARVPARHVWLDAAERDDDEAGYHGPPTGGICAVAAREEAWDDEDEDTDRYVTCDQGHDHWGARGAAGLLVRHQGRYLLQHRSPYVQHGGTWSTPGGALQHGESPERGAMREAEEEFGSLPSGLKHHHTYSDDHGGWAYHTVVMDSPHQFSPHGGGDGDWETQGHGWFTPEEMKGLQLHPGFAASWAKVRKSGAAQVPEREVREYEGTVGDPSHITRSEKGLMPTSAVAGLPGNRGERPGEHRNRQGGAWEDFKRDIAANGIRNPIFVTVDHGQEPRISEGNHRRDAAVELGLLHVPVEVRYFGHAEREGLVQDRGGMRREGAASYEIKFEPDYHGRHRVSAWPSGYQGDTTYGEPLGSMQWHPEDGTVTQLHVRQTRSGVGTALWRRAQEEAARSGITAPAHSPSRTPAADAWAQTVGGETPPLSEESQDPKWIASLPEDAQFRPRTAAYDPDSRIVRNMNELGWGDEEWAAARREPWHAASKLAQQQVRQDHPKLTMKFPDQHSGGDEMVGHILRHVGYQGDVSGAFVARHPDPSRRTSNPSWLRGAPGVALHPERWDYGTVTHEAAHHAVMYDHAAGHDEYQPDEQVHGPEWAGHYAQGLNWLSKGAGDDFLEHHQFYRGMIDEGLQWKRPSDLDAADRRWREAGTPQNGAQRGLRRQGAAEFPEGIRMVGPEEYGKYQFPDYPPHRTLPALGRHLRRTNPAYYEKLRADVEANGVGNPVLVRFPGTPGYPVKKPQVMDGHHRGAVASELGIDIPVGDYHNDEHHAYSMSAGRQWWRDNGELKAGGIQREAAANRPDWHGLAEREPNHAAFSAVQDQVRRNHPELSAPVEDATGTLRRMLGRASFVLPKEEIESAQAPPGRHDTLGLAHHAAHVITDSRQAHEEAEPRQPWDKRRLPSEMDPDDRSHGHGFAWHYALALDGAGHDQAADDLRGAYAGAQVQVANHRHALGLPRDFPGSGLSPHMPPDQGPLPEVPDSQRKAMAPGAHRNALLDVARDPEPGTRIWRGERRETAEHTPDAESVGMHWSVHPANTITDPYRSDESERPVLWQARLERPAEQAIPRSHPMWRGVHMSMDNEAEVRLRPGTSVHVEGAWVGQPGGGARPVYPLDPGRNGPGWEWHPVDRRVPVSHRPGEGHTIDYSDVGIPKEAAKFAWYHGTASEYQPGDLVDPAYAGKVQRTARPGSAYFTHSLGQATDFADWAQKASRTADGEYPAAHVYEIEPTGGYEEDPDDSRSAWVSRSPLRVVRHVMSKELGDHWPKTAASGYENLTDRSGMIYLDIPEGKVRHLPGGVDDHHITLVYLGKDVGDEAFAEAVRRTREAAGAHPPMEGSIGGLGSFEPSDSSDGKKPVFVPVDVPGIGRLRKSLEDLSASEFKDYKAHVTLAYLDGGEAMPAPHPTVPVSFARLHVKRGDEIESFPFLGHEPKTASTSQVYLHGSRHLWEPGDIIDPAQPHEVNWPEISGPSKVYLETQMPRATDWAQSAGHDGAPFVYHVRPLGQVTRDARSSDPDFADELRTAHETSHPVQVVRRIPVDDPYYQNSYSYRQATLAEVSKTAALPRFFHGTDSKLSEGDLIVPGRPKANAGSDPRHVYFTERYEHAEDAARGAASRHSTRYDVEHGAWAHGEPSEHYVYEVKPTGEWGQDQQLPWTPYSHQSAHPLQVVRDVTRSGGDPDVSKTAAWDRSGSERHGVYLRFGDWPHDEKSYSPAGGYKEEGVSVYDLDRHGDPSIDHGLDRGHVHDAGCDVDEFGLCIHSPDPGEEPDNDPQEEMQGRVHRAERHRYYGEDKPGDTGHLVKGEMSGVGYDGEPLLKNVRRVGDWIDHRHLFLDQAHPHRLARDPAAEDYEEPEEKAPYSYRSHE